MDSCTIYLFNEIDNLGFNGAIIAFMGAVIGAVFVVASDNLLERGRRKQYEKKDRKRAYSRLRGLKHSISTTLKLYSVARIDHLYLSRVYDIQMPPTADEKISFMEHHAVFTQHLDEARYRQNDSALDLGKTRETLEKYLTDIELVFPDINKVRSLNSSIDVSIKNFILYMSQIEESYDNAANQEKSIQEKRKKLADTKERHLKEYPKRVNDLEEKIDNLLSYLESELGKNKAKSRWQFWR